MVKPYPIGHFSIGFKGEGGNGRGLSYCIIHYKGRLSKEKKRKKRKKRKKLNKKRKKLNKKRKKRLEKIRKEKKQFRKKKITVKLLSQEEKGENFQSIPIQRVSSL